MNPAATNEKPNELLTTIGRGPISPAGVVNVSWVFDRTSTSPAGSPPTVTCTEPELPSLSKLKPDSVTSVPPSFGPKFGVAANTTGPPGTFGSVLSRNPSPQSYAVEANEPPATWPPDA